MPRIELIEDLPNASLKIKYDCHGCDGSGSAPGQTGPGSGCVNCGGTGKMKRELTIDEFIDLIDKRRAER